MKIVLGILCGILLAISIVGCSVKTSQKKNTGEEKISVALDYSAAEEEFDAYMIESNLSAFSNTSAASKSISYRYDFTGDGYDDLYRTAMFGSDEVRIAFTVYDPVNKIGYTLTDSSCSYKVSAIDSDGPLITQYDINGNSCQGRIVLEGDSLSFVKDEKVTSE